MSVINHDRETRFIDPNLCHIGAPITAEFCQTVRAAWNNLRNWESQQIATYYGRPDTDINGDEGAVFYVITAQPVRTDSLTDETRYLGGKLLLHKFVPAIE